MKVQLRRFRNDWYDPGRGVATRLAWLAVNGAVFGSWVPWPSSLKAALLRAFGARVGRGVVIKPRVNIKYPWRLSIGDDTWIGEGVWIDSLADVSVGANVCLSQGVMLETGNHDWTRETFDLVVREIRVDDGAWAAVKSVLLPGAHLATHAVLGGGAVLAGETNAYGVYAGSPARRVRERIMRRADGDGGHGA